MLNEEIINYFSGRGERIDAFYLHWEGHKVEKMLLVHPEVIKEELSRIFYEIRKECGTIILRVYKGDSVEVYGFVCNPYNQYTIQPLSKTVTEAAEKMLAVENQIKIDLSSEKRYEVFR